MAAVVKFKTTQEVSVVPVSWIRGNLCLWPPKKVQSKLSSLIEKDVPVTASDAWDAFPIELLGIYATYKEARLKLPKAQEKTDIDTTDSEERGKGKRIKLKRKLSTSSTESEEILGKNDKTPEHYQEAPDAPQLWLNQDASSSQECSFTVSTEKNSESLLNPALGFKLTSSNEAFQRTVLRELQIIKANQKFIMETLIEKSTKCTSSNAISTDMSLIEDIVEVLPITSEENFNIVDERLSDEKSSGQMISYLSRIGGVQCEQGVKFMLRKMLTDEVASKFSLMGLRGKRAFQFTNICKTIMGSVMNNSSWKDVHEKDVEKYISNWLRHAKGRIQQRKLHQIK